MKTLEKDLEQFAKLPKQKRIYLWHTQANVGISVGILFEKVFKYTTICCFGTLTLSFKNMYKLGPLVKMWVEEADNTNLQEIYKAVTLVVACKRKQMEH